MPTNQTSSIDGPASGKGMDHSGMHRPLTMASIVDVVAALRQSFLATPLALNLLLAAAISAVVLPFEAFDGGETGTSLGMPDVVACLAATVLIVLRRHAPVPVLAVSLMAGVWSFSLADDQPIFRVATFLALFTVSASSSRLVAWGAAAVTASALYVASIWFLQKPWFNADNLQQIAWMAVATVAGETARTREAFLVARREQEAAQREQAERKIEEDMRRQVIDERLRIARELHDVVAHHIAVINVQAGVASHLMHTDPNRAAEALAHVRTGASTVLEELGGLLTVMRRTDALPSETAPMPTLADLDRMIASFEATGLEIEQEITGTPGKVAPTIELTAYRIIQESLTNAQKHRSGGNVHLRLEYRQQDIFIQVVNDILPGNATEVDSGHGITGMRERVTAIHGQIDIGPVGQTRYRVMATLPTKGTRP